MKYATKLFHCLAYNNENQSERCLFFVTRTKKKRRVTYKDSFKDIIFLGRSVVKSNRPTSVFIGGDLFVQLSHKSDAPVAAISFDRRLEDICMTEQSVIER